jgi:Peptidase family M23
MTDKTVSNEKIFSFSTETDSKSIHGSSTIANDRTHQQYKSGEIVTANEAGVATGVFTTPIAKESIQRISSSYNPTPQGRVHPVYGKPRAHYGLDIAAAAGTPQVATDGGIVTFAGPAGTAGNVVVIDHGNGIVTRSMHMGKISVTVGQKLKKNQYIGTVGSTGTSTGPHVHWEVLKGRTNGKGLDPYGAKLVSNSINPRQFIENGDYTKYTTEQSTSSNGSSQHVDVASSQETSSNDSDAQSGKLNKDSDITAQQETTIDNSSTQAGQNNRINGVSQSNDAASYQQTSDTDTVYARMLKMFNGSSEKAIKALQNAEPPIAQATIDGLEEYANRTQQTTSTNDAIESSNSNNNVMQKTSAASRGGYGE